MPKLAQLTPHQTIRIQKVRNPSLISSILHSSIHPFSTPPSSSVPRPPLLLQVSATATGGAGGDLVGNHTLCCCLGTDPELCGHGWEPCQPPPPPPWALSRAAPAAVVRDTRWIKLLWNLCGGFDSWLYLCGGFINFGDSCDEFHDFVNMHLIRSLLSCFLLVLGLALSTPSQSCMSWRHDMDKVA